jgi:hypothetical protein
VHGERASKSVKVSHERKQLIKNDGFAGQDEPTKFETVSEQQVYSRATNPYKNFDSASTRNSKRTKRTRRTKQIQQHIDSLTRVNPTRTHGLGLWGNELVVFGVRVDSKLKTAFTKVAERGFGSTCNPIESFMASVVGVYQNPTLDRVNPSITIGEIKIERNLRERRKITHTREVEISETVYSRMDRNLASLKAAGDKCVSKPRVDLSTLSLEQLQRQYDRCGPSGRKMLLAAELKRRGALLCQ